MGKLEKQLKRKEQECEELKEDVGRWKSNFNGKVSAIEELLQQLYQLKRTLIEIKEIVEQQCNICVEIIPIDECKDCEKCWQDKILQKISEVEK